MIKLIQAAFSDCKWNLHIEMHVILGIMLCPPAAGSACDDSFPCSYYNLFPAAGSACDDTVPGPLRGKYLAFSPQHILEAGSAAADATHGSSGRELQPPTAGLQHLAKLRQAGLNHLHLLPTYDFASVPEREEDQRKVKVNMRSLSLQCYNETQQIQGL
jgi:hypothetical protein